jgi:putative membrane protein
LEHKSGDSFDSAYMKQMDKDHQKTIEMFQSAASSTKLDPELKALASKLLPKLQEHANMVAQIEPKTSSRSASSR